MRPHVFKLTKTEELAIEEFKNSKGKRKADIRKKYSSALTYALQKIRLQEEIDKQENFSSVTLLRTARHPKRSYAR